MKPLYLLLLLTLGLSAQNRNLERMDIRHEVLNDTLIIGAVFKPGDVLIQRAEMIHSKTAVSYKLHECDFNEWRVPLRHYPAGSFTVSVIVDYKYHSFRLVNNAYKKGFNPPLQHVQWYYVVYDVDTESGYSGRRWLNKTEMAELVSKAETDRLTKNGGHNKVVVWLVYDRDAFNREPNASNSKIVYP